MPIFYALIAREKTVLVEWTSRMGNFPTVTRVLLNKITTDDQKMSYAYDKFIFNILVEDGITYLCLTDEEDRRKRRVAFAFLEDIKERFRRDYGPRVHSAIAFAMNAEFQSVLEERMDDDNLFKIYMYFLMVQRYFNEDPGADSFGRVHGQLSQVKEVMVENIERVLARGEKIELLVEKTEELSASAKRFQHGSRQLRWVMYCQNVKMWAAIIFIVALIIFVIVGFACKWNFKHCGG